MKLVAASMLLLVSVGGGLVAWFAGWIKVPESYSGQTAPSLAFGCHNAVGLQPCHCDQKWYDYVETNILVCPKLDNELKLRSPLSVVLERYPQINAFHLDNSVLRFFPAEVFKGQKFKRIKILQSTITVLTDSDLAFVGLEHELEFLTLADVVLQSDWDWSIFKKLSSLKELEVNGLTIDTLDKVPDDSLMSPKTVIFVNNKMTELHPEVFQNFKNLYILKVRYNQIKSIKRTMFPIPASNLKTLDLGYTEIETLPDDAFTDMPVLTDISLERTKILTLNEKAFKPVLKQIRSIDVHMNDLECDCRLLWTVGVDKKFNFLLYGYCAEPPRLKGRDLQTLRSEELYC